MRSSRRKRTSYAPLTAAVALGIVIVLLLFALRPRGVSQTKSQGLTAGITYLEELEGASVNEMESYLAERREQVMERERSERLRQLESGEIDVWSLFQDFMLMGDSRAVGFSFWGFLPEERVLADGGWTIRNIEENMDRILALNPSSLYLCFGLNDLGVGYWDTPEAYTAEFKDVLQELQKELPHMKIYVNSSLPVIGSGYENNPELRETQKYNAAVEAMCAEIGVTFIDNEWLGEEYSTLYDPDGIHFKESFYPYWAANMMMKVYEEDQEEIGG